MLDRHTYRGYNAVGHLVKRSGSTDLQHAGVAEPRLLRGWGCDEEAIEPRTARGQ